MALTSWAAHVVQWPVQWVAKRQRQANPTKTGLSPDRGLQLDLVKLESLVIANQLRRDEYVTGSCTHRPSRQESWEHPKCPYQIRELRWIQ